jgi:hypothetical protein
MFWTHFAEITASASPRGEMIPCASPKGRNGAGQSGDANQMEVQHSAGTLLRLWCSCFGAPKIPREIAG